MTGLIESLRRERPFASQSEIEAVVRQQSGSGFQELLDDETITEILIVGRRGVWIERNGALHRSDVVLSDDQVAEFVSGLLEPLGLRVDRLSPIVDARLDDGSRVNVVIPPLALDGPAVTIRKFAQRPFPLASFTVPAAARLLGALVANKASLLVVGATGTGKTSLLNALGAQIGNDERVITIEDTAELQLPGPHVVRLESRPASAEGVGAVPLRDLVKAALRMRPDRIIVGEVRGGEALDLLLALTSGHNGSLTTCHASAAGSGLARLSTLAVLAEAALPLEGVRRLVADAIDAVVVVARTPKGRQVIEIAEVGADLTPHQLWPPANRQPRRHCVVRAVNAVADRCLLDDASMEDRQ